MSSFQQDFITIQTSFFFFTYLISRQTYCTQEPYENLTQYDVGTVPCQPNLNQRNDSKNISNKKDCKRKIKSIFKLLIGIEMDGTVKS